VRPRRFHVTGSAVEDADRGSLRRIQRHGAWYDERRIIGNAKVMETFRLWKAARSGALLVSARTTRQPSDLDRI
jgi:hypothetical protein